jgi:hypothetical protein
VNAPKDVLLEVGLEIKTGNLLDDPSKPVDGRPIDPGRAGLVPERHLVEALLRAGARGQTRRYEREKRQTNGSGILSVRRRIDPEVLRQAHSVLDVVEEVDGSGSVGKEHSNRHDLLVLTQNRLVLLLVPLLEDLNVGELRNVFRGVVVQCDLALLDELKRRNGADQLGARKELKDRLLVDLLSLCVRVEVFKSDGRRGNASVASGTGIDSRGGGRGGEENGAGNAVVGVGGGFGEGSVDDRGGGKRLRGCDGHVG